MNYKYDVDKIVLYLQRYKDDLPTLYNWNANIHRLAELNVLSEEQIAELNSMPPYEKELLLKQIVRKELNTAYTTRPDFFNDLCLWVIKDWGGISAGKDTDTLDLIQSFLTQKKAVFNRIASSSKVASYMYPERFIIYDSRVAYSLNWIILSQRAGDYFFPIPEGRNSKMSAFDMNVLIRLTHIEHYKVSQVQELDNRKYINRKDKSLFIPEKEAYDELNKLIRQVSDKLWSDEKCQYLYFTEMLLFAIADREIYRDITNRLSLGINENDSCPI